MKGGMISNSYFGQVNGFEIKPLNNGRKHPILFINGFLCEDCDDCTDWQSGVKDHFSTRTQHLVRWESKTLRHLGKLACADATGATVGAIATKLAERTTRMAGSKLNPLTYAALLADLIGNPWYCAMLKAQMTGVLLADLLCRVKDTRFVLMGHSLGCRVIYFALHTLGTKLDRCVQDVYLLGGAVGRSDTVGWQQAAEAVCGKIHNCYSSNDGVLKYMYKSASAFMSDPIGARPIECQHEHL